MKKSYKIAVCELVAGGFAVLLDGKQARTPLGKVLIMPYKALAEAVAHEWQSQGDSIRKETMPLTQTACVAIDLTTERADAVIADIIPYADTDLVCYRAGDIPVLLAEQASVLDPIVGWAKERFGLVLNVTHDVMPIAQPPENATTLAAILSQYDAWTLAVFAGLVKPLGSCVLALAVVEKYIDAETAFRVSHLEEAYETQKWGLDEEKEQRLKTLRNDIFAIGRFLSLLLSSAN